MFYKQFYSELGKLLYAVANVDGTISQKEKKSLHDLVAKELVPVEHNKDEFGTDAAYYAEIEFDILEEVKPNPKAAFESFLNFIENHKTAIDKNMILATRKVATKLANTYHHANENEKQLLKGLNRKLNALLKEKK